MNTCTNESNHTPMPDGYLARQEWVRMMVAQKSSQERCFACGLYVVWVGKEAPIPPGGVPQTCFAGRAR